MGTDKNIIKSGFVAIAGRPNSGKSTFLNSIADMKMSIVSDKPQTTRDNIMYIHNDSMSQIIFTDTPGVHSSKDKLGEKMNARALRAVIESDIVLLIIDARHPEITQTEISFCDTAKDNDKPVILLINKTDIIEKEKLLPIIKMYSEKFTLNEIIPVSALKNIGLDSVIKILRELLPEGPRYYPEETITDQTEKSLASEIIREKVIRFTSEEIPHGIAVEINRFEEITDENERKLVKIKADIFCEKESHKKMIIGKGGQMVKRIGTAARMDMERMLHNKVYLELFVKVKKDWRNDEQALFSFGYRDK